MLDHGQVVSDEQITQPQFILQIQEQVEDLALNRYVQRRYGFVQNQKIRADRKGPGNANALTLTARKLERKLLGGVFGKTD